MKKSFGLASAIFLGIGSMVGAGIFVLLGEAGAIAGNLVWIAFILGGIIALSAGYSLAKLSITYPSRGGIVEYLVQCYGEGIFSGSISILFYISSLVGIAMVTKTFGVYAAHISSEDTPFYINIYSIGILLFFALINLVGSSWIAKSENVIVITKLTILIAFTAIVFFYITPELLSFKNAPAFNNVFFAMSLTFFGYGGFSVIANTVEDMDNPQETVMKAMLYTILIVMFLYVSVSIAVFGSLSLSEIIKAQDYALAEAAKPVFGQIGFTIMAVAALVSTSSSINANLYAATNITYQMAKDGDLPKIYERNVWHSTEGLLVSTGFLIVMVLFFNLQEIATLGAIFILFVHIFVHVGHLLKIGKTGSSKTIIIFSIVSLCITVVLSLIYTSKHIEGIGYYVVGGFVLSFALEVIFRLVNKRKILKQIKG